jgi:Leucine-rich repeat (LRR) protein
LQQLFTLRLGDNQITAIPASIARLQQLQKLHLYSNQFTYIPEVIYRLSSLRVLDFETYRSNYNILVKDKN